MFGIYSMDEGEVIYEGQKVNIKDPLEALHMGIAMVHQELQPIPARTIGENIFLGRYPMKKFLGIIPVVDHEKMYADTAALLEKVRMNFNPKQMLGELSVSQMQSVEIAKAVSANCKVLILDEPTSSLTANEVEALFRIIEDLKADGVAIVYISHKMDEILRISDEVTVMRDGQYIGTWDAKTLTTDFIISKMVGRDLTNLFPERHNVPGEVVFEVENFASINPRSFRNVSFSLRKGEILGVGGLVGAQRTELMEGLFGIRSHTTGTIRYQGKELVINRPKDAIDQGIAMLTEDRRATGIMGVLSIADNISVASLKQYLDYGFILNDKKIEALVQDNIKKMNTKTPSSKTQIKSLSGGNQQKVLIGRWLANNPDVLILDEPTRGIDVGAKYEIYCIIEELARSGKSIIMISSEMAELIGMSDRVMVMCDGRVTGFIDGKDANQENIMELATQFETV
jgi:methyl-galactoside transport system ATP-binding protein